MPEKTKPALLMISNFLQATRHNKNVWHYLAQRLEQRGYQVLTVSSKENRVLRLLDMLWTAWCRRRSYDLAQIDVFSGKAFIFAEACTALLGWIQKPIILTLHGGALPEFSQRHPRRVRRLLQAAAAVVTPSPYLMNELVRFRANIRLIPNPIDLDASIFRVREHPQPKLIWVRAFHKVYNPTLAVEVVAALADSFPDISLTMIGPDKADGSLEQVLERARALGVSDCITIIPGVPHHEIPTWLDGADIFINTSNYDTSPRSLVEAMANGLCIVTTDVGGIPYLVEDHQEALLVPPSKTQLMSEAVRKILSDPTLAARLSGNARSKTRQYDWPSILQTWESLFIEVRERSYG